MKIKKINKNYYNLYPHLIKIYYKLEFISLWFKSFNTKKMVFLHGLGQLSGDKWCHLHANFNSGEKIRFISIFEKF